MDVSDIFSFFCSGRGKGESEAPEEKRDRFFIANPRRGGVPGGAEGAKYFLGGRNVHQEKSLLGSLWRKPQCHFLVTCQSLSSFHAGEVLGGSRDHMDDPAGTEPKTRILAETTEFRRFTSQGTGNFRFHRKPPKGTI